MNTNIITYKINSDRDDKLKAAAKLSCDFWNKYLIPKSPIVIRLGVFTRFGSTIARAYKPSMHNGTVYGLVEFNTKYLSTFEPNEIVGTIIHEIGHTLGMGWDQWMNLFDRQSGQFKPEFVNRLPALDEMTVETEYGPGTRFSHWDEKLFDKELMTGFKDNAEHVLPITIDVMELLGHKVVEKLAEKTPLSNIIMGLQSMLFSRMEDVKPLDKDYEEETELWEEIYTDRKGPKE